METRLANLKDYQMDCQMGNLMGFLMGFLMEKHLVTQMVKCSVIQKVKRWVCLHSVTRSDCPMATRWVKCSVNRTVTRTVTPTGCLMALPLS